MSGTWDGLDCGHDHAAPVLEAQNEDIGRNAAATSNVTDLRRARQRARATMRDILDAVETWMAANGIQSMITTDSGARRANRAITEIAAERFQQNLVNWLIERNRITAGRAARKAIDQMMGSLDGVDRDRLDGQGQFDRRLDSETLRLIRSIDAGLLYDTELAEQMGLNEPLAEEIGDDITRQLRLGVDQGESLGTLGDRVRYVLTEGDAGERQELGVTGQTKKTKAELIAHDSVQDAYNQTARGRYLRNGFRYAVFDAVIDFKTSQVCRRMDEYVIDIVDSPYLMPPLHPWCRSGLRPILDIGDKQVLTRDDVADGYLQTIQQTKSYRPPANVSGQFRPTAITRDQGQA